MILIVDISNLVYRYAFATRSENPELVASAVIDAVTYRAALQRASKTIAVFDGARGSAWRKTIFPEYKADRSERPAVVGPTFEVLRRTLQRRNISIQEHDAYEADDMIASLAASAARAKEASTIFSSDGDLFQCIDERVNYAKIGQRVGTPRIWTNIEFVAERGYAPRYFPDVKALMGDGSDNLPSVPGIGEGYAQKLIIAYRSLGGLFAAAHADQLAITKFARLVPALLEHEEQTMKNFAVMTLDRNAPISYF